MIPSKAEFQHIIEGKHIALYVLKSSGNMQVAITNYGGRVVSIIVPDKDGNLIDVALGYETIFPYLNDPCYFGTITGRYANRIANGKFKLDGKVFRLAINNGLHALHGGPTGLHSRVWNAEMLDEQTLELSYISKDGEEGFPGNLTLKVVYKVSNDNSLMIEYLGRADKKTIINLTNHTYFNLNGEGSGDITDHLIKINAEYFIPTRDDFIPTGEIRHVNNTPFDLRELTVMNTRINLPDIQLICGEGFNHTFVIAGKENSLKKAATAIGPDSGIKLEVLTTEPGVLLYSGNSLNGMETYGKGGRAYNFREGFCLETQHYPNSVNQPDFPTTVLEAGEEFSSSTIYKFSVI